MVEDSNKQDFDSHKKCGNRNEELDVEVEVEETRAMGITSVDRTKHPSVLSWNPEISGFSIGMAISMIRKSVVCVIDLFEGGGISSNFQ